MRCNRNELAKLLGRHVKTLDTMVEKGMPYISKPDRALGQTGWVFESRDVIEWLTRNILDAKIREAETRIALAKAQMKEIELEVIRGNMVSVDDEIDRIADGNAIVKSRINAMPGRLAQLVAIESDPAIVQKMIEREVEGALKNLYVPQKDNGR